jgi:hypothetical protein
MRLFFTVLAALVALATGLHALRVSAQSADALSAPRYGADARLELPDDIDRWIQLGTSFGGDYADLPFDPENPGSFGVVQMEPSAYDHFLEHKTYADGTMLLLTFYPAAQKPEPPLQGFTQADAALREIHVIDRTRFAEEGRAFFVFRPGEDTAAAVAPGSECVQCHTEHGAHDATFTQFYPTIRHLLPDHGGD